MPVLEVAHKITDIERTDDVKITENTTFDGLMLSNETLQGLKSSGFIKPSPVQLRAIPLGKCGFDLIVEAKSGTGKTAVFGIIALEMIIKNGGFQVLILAPTREIASQIGTVLKSIGSSHSDLIVETVMGGTNINDDVKRLKGKKFQILVGSPGRILHLIKKNTISTRSVRLFVLDEADKLMEDSFQSDINCIFSHLPERKQLIAASATYTVELRTFLENYMKTPSHICPHISNILLGVTQNIVLVSSHENNVRQNKIKLQKAIEIISHTTFKQCLIFCQYQIRAQSICESLSNEGWPSEFLAGSQTQSDRLNSLQKLQSFSCRILVATDLAARGIDASNVDLVINIDIPGDYPTYLHRIGRAGRYGSKGTAITILTDKEENIFNQMVTTLGESNIPQLDISINNENNSNKNVITKPTMVENSIENNTGPLNLSLISSIRKKAIICESFDELMTSMKNFTIDESVVRFSKDNLDLSKYISEQKASYVPVIDNTNSPCTDYKTTNILRKKKKSSHNVSKKFNQYDDDSSVQSDQNKKNNVYKSKNKKKHVPKPIASHSEYYLNSNTNDDCSYEESDENHDVENNLDYVQWRRQLEAMSQQIYQMAYINTLIEIDRYIHM